MRYNIAIEVDQTSTPGTVIVTKATDGTITIRSEGITASGSDTPILAPDVEDMIRRHEKNGHQGSRSRELTYELIRRGWEAKAGPKYLRFIHRSDDGRATLYANSRDLMTRERRDYAASLPDAIPEKNEVRWRYFADNLDSALQAADCLAVHASVVGGQDPDEE